MFAASCRSTRCTRINVLQRLLAAIVLGLAAAGLFAGCGSGDGDLPGPSATEFSNRFAKVTGLKLVGEKRVVPSAPWTLLNLPGTQHFDRFGAFSIYVVKSKRARDQLLRTSEDESTPLKPNSAGYAFRRNEGSDSYSLLQRFGENIVLVWQAGEKQQVDDSYRRLATAIEAAASGDESKVPASQRDCKQAGIDPQSGKEGSCRVGDRQIIVVNSGSQLITPVLKARLRTVGDTERIEPPSAYGTPDMARGRYLIVTYELTNSGKSPIDDIEPQLVVDERTYAAASGVDYDLYGDQKRPWPLQPGDTATVITAFDVSPEIVDAARDRGALVLPAESDQGGYLSVERSAAEGRIRLAGAAIDDSAGRSRSATSGSSPYSRPNVPPPPSSGRASGRERRAERAMKQFFSAVRAGSAPGVCSRLTRETLAKEGGMASCRRKRVAPTIKRRVPRSNRRLRLTTILSHRDTRATVLVRKSGYRGIVRLALQQGRWRVQGVVGGPR